jgi:hypothetical protein
MITPTNGRIVWYTPGPDFAGVQHDRSKPLAASVCHVWGDRCVNLDVTDSNGAHWPVTSVTLLQDEDTGNSWGGFAEWMPFQKGQAKAAT